MNIESQDRQIQTGTGDAAGPHIAFVDRDDVFRTALSACLRAEGFQVTEFRTKATALQAIGRGEMDAILIDPRSGDGHMSFKELRQLNVAVPVAVIASKADNLVEEAAFHNGASDFLAKSRGPTIIAKRLRLLISGVRGGREAWSPDPEDIIHVGHLALRLESHRALWRGTQVPLTVTEFKIVRLLACGLGKVYSYREIYDVVHGAGFVAGDGLDGFRINVRALIKKIRKRFRDIDTEFDEIENVPGRGYQWRRHGRPDAAALLPDLRPARDASLAQMVA